LASGIHVILVGLGSAGDVHPNVGIGRELRRRGHRVTLVAASVFRELAADAGLEFFGLGKDEDHEAVIRNPDLWNPMKAFPLVVNFLMVPFMAPVYEFIARNYVPGRTVVAAPGTAFGARMAQEKLGVPLATMHLQPSLLRSSLDPGTYMIPDIVAPMPVWLRKIYYRIVDKLMIDRLLAPGVNAFRTSQGLPPVQRFFNGWLHSPRLVMGLFPDWFAPRPADWPANFHHAGFPLFDESEVRKPLPDLDAFLAEGDPPYVFTAGSVNMHAQQFFRVATEVCVASRRRGILIARFAEQIPAALPPTVRHFEYVPFSRVLPRAAAFVHHGGIGTAAQSFAAGVPQLVMPLAHDQFDNAMRVRKLGCGDFVLPKHFTTRAVADKLGELAAGKCAPSCGGFAREIARATPVKTACDLIEGLSR